MDYQIPVSHFARVFTFFVTISVNALAPPDFVNNATKPPIIVIMKRACVFIELARAPNMYSLIITVNPKAGFQLLTIVALTKTDVSNDTIMFFVITAKIIARTGGINDNTP